MPHKGFWKRTKPSRKRKTKKGGCISIILAGMLLTGFLIFIIITKL